MITLPVLELSVGNAVTFHIVEGMEYDATNSRPVSEVLPEVEFDITNHEMLTEIALDRLGLNREALPSLVVASGDPVVFWAISRRAGRSWAYLAVQFPDVVARAKREITSL